MTDRQSLHKLVDQIPDEELHKARTLLERLSELELDDGDVLNAEDLETVERAREDVRKGDYITLDQYKRDRGL